MNWFKRLWYSKNKETKTISNKTRELLLNDKKNLLIAIDIDKKIEKNKKSNIELERVGY